MDRVSRNLALRPNYTMEEYQRWFDHNPDFKHNGNAERIELIEPLSLVGTNQLYRAKLWMQHPRDEKRYDEKEIVVKICKYWAPPGKNRLHRLNMLLSAFQDEIRINNLVRATNIEGVVQSFGGGIAGRHPFLKLEFIKGCALDRVIKPKNLLLCQNPAHKNNHKILLCDFGYAQAKMRETVTEGGGLSSPSYSAPELAQSSENITYAVDYFSFGAVMHEYLTGVKLYPKAKEIYTEEGRLITKRYMEYIENGRENVFNDDRFPEIHEWIDALTTFDANERMKKSPNLFALAHKLREEVNAQGFRDVNTDFLWNQLNEYGKRTF